MRFTEPIDGTPVVHRISVEHGSLTPFGSNLSIADLADDQLAAVTHSGGASRVIAPAGSGKTRVLTERARHLLTRWRLPAGAVCLVAFNKRAQEEMSTRVADLPGLQVRTLNAIALAIVNGSPPFAAQPTSLTTITELDVRRIIGRLVDFPRKRNSDPVALWIEALSLADSGFAIRRGRVAVRRRRRWVRRRAAPVSARTRCVALARLRRTDRAGHRDPAHRHRRSRRCPTRLPACYWSTSSKTSLPRTCCWSACWPDPTDVCSAWATTTRRSTASTARTRTGSSSLPTTSRTPATIRCRSTTAVRPTLSRRPQRCCSTTCVESRSRYAPLSSATGMTFEPSGDPVAATARIVTAVIVRRILDD